MARSWIELVLVGFCIGKSSKTTNGRFGEPTVCGSSGYVAGTLDMISVIIHATTILFDCEALPQRLRGRNRDPHSIVVCILIIDFIIHLRNVLLVSGNQ